MAEKVSYRLTPETRKLLPEHGDFYESVLDLYNKGQSPLILKARDPEAKVEAEIKDNGEVEVSFVIPLDDNDESADGRLLIRDRFLFDPTNKVIKDYHRSFEHNGKGSAANWQAWLKKYQGLLQERPKLNDPLVQRFGLNVARTYSLPVVDKQELTLPKFRAAFGREHRYLDSTDALIQDQGARQGVQGLRLRIKEEENHYQILRQADGKVELVFNFAVEADGIPENGRIWLKDRFILQGRDYAGFIREWSLDPRLPGDANYAAILEGLKQRPNPSREEVQTFAENLYPDLVPQGSPNPNDLTPLLVAGLEGPSGESVFKDRKRAGSEDSAVKDEIQVFVDSLKNEDSAKRSDEVQGLLSFGSPAESQDLSGLAELKALGLDTDKELRNESLIRISRKLFDQGYPATALAIAESLAAAPKVKGRAKKLIDLIQGKGALGSKVEFAFGHFHKELAKPSMLVGMMAAPFAGVAFEAAGLRFARYLYDIGKIRRLSTGIKLAASGAGLLGESLAFTGIHRSYERLWHGSETAWHGAGNEILSSALLFTTMRAAHLGGTWLSSRTAEGKLNFKLRGRSVLFGQRQGTAPYAPNLATATATGRLTFNNPWIPEAGIGAPTLNGLGKFSSAALNHLGSIAALQVSSWASGELGLVPVAAQGFLGTFFDSTVAYLQAIMGFRLANKASGGRLHPSLGEAKMRLGMVDSVDLPRPNNPAARRGLHRPQIPELRLFDQNQGNAMFDLRFAHGREVSLDNILFSQDTRRVMVGMDPQGIYLIDRRSQVLPLLNVPAHHARILNFAEAPMLINRSPIANMVKVHIQEGDLIQFGLRELRITQPRSSSLYTQLSQLQPRAQMRLGARVDAATNIHSMISAIDAEGPALSGLASYVRDIWEGPGLLHGLPVELGLQGKLEALIKADLRRGEREGLNSRAVKLKPSVDNPRWSPLEKSLHINQAIEKLQGRLKEASSIHEATNILRTFIFDQVEGKTVSEISMAMAEAAFRQRGSLQDLPYTSGIRQRTRDILERDNYWASIRARDGNGAPRPNDPTMRRDYAALHGSLLPIYEKIRTSEVLRREASEYNVGQLEELVYQVLERGAPLEILPAADGLRGQVAMYQSDAVRCAERLFPVDMNVRIDPWTGERIDPMNREARYRLALHVLNRGAGRPVLGIPSLHERSELARLVKRDLNDRVGSNFLIAQEVLRDHFDRATPEAQRLLRKARPEEKALLLAMYFGPFRRRDLAPATAFQVSTWMGQAGMYREVGVTYEVRNEALRSTLSLGNLGNVEPQHRDDFFSLHTHPEGYRNSDGGNMGYESQGHVHTINLADARISRSTLNILPSQVDLRLYFEKSQEYWTKGYPLRFGETPLFKSEGNRFRNWVIHSLGLSQVDVALDGGGRPQRIEVRFAARRLARLLNGEYQRQKGDLEAMSAEFGIPVVITEAEYGDLMSEMPYGVRSIFDTPD